MLSTRGTYWFAGPRIDTTSGDFWGSSTDQDARHTQRASHSHARDGSDPNDLGQCLAEAHTCAFVACSHDVLRNLNLATAELGAVFACCSLD